MSRKILSEDTDVQQLFWGAHASGVLVAGFCVDELFLCSVPNSPKFAIAKCDCQVAAATASPVRNATRRVQESR